MFISKRIIFEKDSLEYDMAREVLAAFKDNADIEIINLTSNKLKQNIPGDGLSAQYKEGKKTLVVGTKKSLKFQSCKPSAHYQLPLISGCMGQCQYCYLNTMLGDKPFIKINANIDDILNQAQKYINERLPDDLKFPVTFEVISHSYTTTAKNRILQVFPETILPMNDEDRKFKYGQFGYGKYVYPKESLDEIKQFFLKEIEDLLSNKEVKYII